MDWLRGHFTEQELAAGDLVSRRVFQALAADTKLQAIYGQAMTRYAVVPPPDRAGRAQDLCVAPFLADVERRAGHVGQTVSVYIVHRFHWDRLTPQANGDAGMATLVAYVDRLLSSAEHSHLQMTVAGYPGTVDLVTRGDAQPVTYRFEPIDETRAVLSLIQEWLYQLRTNDEGQVLNLRAAGFYDQDP